LSDELTDWENSKLPREYFADRFESLRPLMDWSKNPMINVEYGSEILGCVSQRRHSLSSSGGYDFTIWLDTDIFFKDTTLPYLISSYETVVESGYDCCIITPQFIRQWDATWDVLVHEAFLGSTLNTHEDADIIKISLFDAGEVAIKPITGFKFGGGWCTLLSNKLLRIIGIPEVLGHYGLEDTFITSACDMMWKRNTPNLPIQFVLQNHIVGEVYKHRCNQHMKRWVTSRNRKDEFRAIATQNFSQAMAQLVRGM